MTSTNRQRGDGFERRTMRHLVEHGYVCARSSGSHGPFDVIALRHREVLLVQCKIDGRLDPGEWNALLVVAEWCEASAVLAQRVGPSNRIEFRRLLAPKTRAADRDGTPLWEPWQPVLDVGW